MVDKKEVTESIDSYLGEREKEVLKTLTLPTIKMFIKKKVRLNTSYYVYGSRKRLAQFKAFYLLSCLKEPARPKYSLQMISERVKSLFNDSPDDIGVDDILFIYVHKNDTGYGKTDDWVTSTIINDVANRNRKGYVTIVLSERPLPELANCGELKPVYLDTVTVKRAEDITQQGKVESNVQQSTRGVEGNSSIYN